MDSNIKLLAAAVLPLVEAYEQQLSAARVVPSSGRIPMGAESESAYQKAIVEQNAPWEAYRALAEQVRALVRQSQD